MQILVCPRVRHPAFALCLRQVPWRGCLPRHGATRRRIPEPPHEYKRSLRQSGRARRSWRRRSRTRRRRPPSRSAARSGGGSAPRRNGDDHYFTTIEIIIFLLLKYLPLVQLLSESRANRTRRARWRAVAGCDTPPRHPQRGSILTQAKSSLSRTATVRTPPSNRASPRPPMTVASRPSGDR